MARQNVYGRPRGEDSFNLGFRGRATDLPDALRGSPQRLQADNSAQIDEIGNAAATCFHNVRR